MSRDDDSVTVTENPGAVTEEQPNQAATTEAPAESTQTTAPAEGTETKPEGPSEADQAAAFEAFKSKVSAAVEQVDRSTGTLPDGLVAEVKAAYAALPLPKNKTAARNHLDASMKEQLTKPPFDPFVAKAYLDLLEAVKSTGSTRETVAKPPVDPTEAFVERVSAHWIATSLLVAGPDVDPSYPQRAQELSQSLQGDAQAYKAYLIEHAAWAAKPEAERGDEPQAPEVHKVVLEAAKIAAGRTTRTRSASASTGAAKSTGAGPTYSGPRRDIKAHIQSAFADKPVGTFLKIGEIAKHVSAEYGGSNPAASGGAINAAFKSPRFAESVKNIVPDTEGGVGGARKIA